LVPGITAAQSGNNHATAAQVSSLKLLNIPPQHDRMKKAELSQAIHESSAGI